MKIQLSAITDALDMIWEEWSIYLNRETGEIINLPNEAFALAEENESEEEIDEALTHAEIVEDENDITIAQDILNHPERYACLPDQYDINEYEIMRDFSQSYEDEHICGELCDAITGRGAFRFFKSTIARLGIRDEYFAFKEKAYKKIAREWCEVNKIEYYED
ncbi:MAG: hypothetical protein IJI67_06135 [Clostridia bacterium]|nr:hypothetical protein [Clostridia bacterium]